MMSMEQDPRRRQIQRDHVSIGSLAKRKGHQDYASQTSKRKKCSGRLLPEDIWHHICSFLPLKDALRAARVSRAFQRSWSCHPNLTFSMETMGFNENAHMRSEMAIKYNKRVCDILVNHSGVGLKKLHLEFYGPYNANTSDCLHSWLRIAVKPGIEELTFILHSNSEQSLNKRKCDFPCSLLSNGSGNSVRALDIVGCALRPREGLCCTRSLTSLSLCNVHIMARGLGFLLSNSFALERLVLNYCDMITSIEIPFVLQRLSRLTVSHCDMLKVIESKAPNISSFEFDFDKKVELLLGEALRVKKIEISYTGVLHDARATLPSSMPNLETLIIYSSVETISTQMLPSKFLHLKYLHITAMECSFLAPYDLFSLVSFIDASPCLETFDLYVSMRRWEQDLTVEVPLQFERIPGHHYDNLRRVSITGFCSRKMLVKLTCHILENTPTLECLTLNMTPVGSACSGDVLGVCLPSMATFVESSEAVEAIRTYIEEKVPSTAKLNVVEPCNRCRGIDI